MSKPSGYFIEGRGDDRKVHPLFKSRGHKRQHQSRFVDPSRDEMSKSHIRSMSSSARESFPSLINVLRGATNG